MGGSDPANIVIIGGSRISQVRKKGNRHVTSTLSFDSNDNCLKQLLLLLLLFREGKKKTLLSNLPRGIPLAPGRIKTQARWSGWLQLRDKTDPSYANDISIQYLSLFSGYGRKY